MRNYSFVDLKIHLHPNLAFTHKFIVYSFIQWIIYPPIHSIIHSFIMSLLMNYYTFIHNFFHSFAYPPIHSWIFASIHPFIENATTYSFIHSFIYPFIHKFSHLFIHSWKLQLLIHPFILNVICLSKKFSSFSSFHGSNIIWESLWKMRIFAIFWVSLRKEKMCKFIVTNFI